MFLGQIFVKNAKNGPKTLLKRQNLTLLSVQYFQLVLNSVQLNDRTVCG